MRLLSIFAALAAVLWSGYWFGGSSVLQQQLEQQLAARFGADDAVQISHQGLSVTGFPGRFDLSLRDFTLTDPGNRLRWYAPDLQIQAASYHPHKVTVAPGGRQVLQINGQQLRIESQALTATVALSTQALLRGAQILEMAQIKAKALELSARQWGALQLDAAQMDATPATDLYDLYQLDLTATTLRLPDALRQQLDPATRLPEQIEQMHLRGLVRLKSPLDLTKRVRLSGIKIRDYRLNWGEVQLSGHGDLQLDRKGYPTGELQLVVHGWQSVYQMAKDAALFDPSYERAIYSALESAAKLSEAADGITLPVRFAERQIFVLGLPIAPAPRL
ncbi:MAG: hypothetical protein CSA68_10210 [Rhodobacterales bacterium]|nr:MAG: hypothetical protein CSA68_10210 [Rhodobacterales bacterium]